MAILLAMFQKMRLVREKNELTYKSVKHSSKIKRIQDNIARVQKMYEGRMAKIKSQAQMMSSQANIFFQAQMGFGAGSVNPYNYGGTNEYVLRTAKSLLCGDGATGVPLTKEDYENKTGRTISDEQFTKFMNALAMGGVSQKTVDGETGYYIGDEQLSEDDVEDYKAFNAAMQIGRQQQTMAQQQCSMMQQQYASNLSIWQQAQEAQLEAEQDAALEPLKYEESMMEIDKNAIDSRLEYVRAELEAITQLCKEEAKSSVPSFGL